MKAAMAFVVQLAWAARANPQGNVRIVFEAVATDSKQNTEPATLATSGRPLAMAGEPPVTVRVLTAEWYPKT